jgi:PAS domain-containing protein
MIPTSPLEAGHPADGNCSHFVQFYDEPTALADVVSRFVGDGIEAGSGGVMPATAPNRTLVAEKLSRRGIDLDRLEAQGLWASLDAKQSLDKFMVDGLPHPVRFREFIDPVLRRISDEGRRPRPRAFGEMVALLWQDGQREAAVRLEKLWNEVGRDHSISLFCAYPMRAFGGEAAAQAFVEICAEHAHVLPSETYVGGSLEQRHRIVSELQQKSIALDAEVARRREVEDLLQRREKELSDYLEGTQEAVVDVEPDGTIRWSNPAFLTLVGGNPEELRNVNAFLGNPGLLDDLWSRLLRGEPVRGRHADIRRPDGLIERTRVQSCALRAAGRAVHMRWFLRRGNDAT